MAENEVVWLYADPPNPVQSISASCCSVPHVLDSFVLQCSRLVVEQERGWGRPPKEENPKNSPVGLSGGTALTHHSWLLLPLPLPQIYLGQVAADSPIARAPRGGAVHPQPAVPTSSRWIWQIAAGCTFEQCPHANLNK